MLVSHRTVGTSYAMIVANLGFFSMNVRGYLKWAPPEK